MTPPLHLQLNTLCTKSPSLLHTLAFSVTMTESGLLVDYLQLSTCGKGSKVERLEIDDRAAVLVPRYAISMPVFGESSRGSREEWSETQSIGETRSGVKMW